MKRLLGRRLQNVYSQAVGDYREKILSALPFDSSLQLLDVGCDDGEWTQRLADRMTVAPSQVSGIEILEQRRQIAQAKGFEVRAGDIEDKWPFEDQSFDVVHANQVIEHVKRLDHFVAESWRVVRPGGCVVVCTENLASWPNVFALTLGFMPFSLTNISGKGAIGNPLALHQEWDVAPGESWQHVHVVTLRALREIFEYRGFEIVSTFGAGYFPAIGSVSRRLATKSPKRAHFIGIVAGRPTR